MKLTAEQRVQRAHVSLMNDPKYCLYSGVLMLGKTDVADDVPTACTNGRDVTYGRKFVDKLAEAELKGLILHENLHKAFRHMTTWESLYKQDAQLANMACDYVINLMIHDSDPDGKNVRLPEGGLLDQKYRGMDAATVFRLLKQQGAGNGKGGGGNSQGKTGQPGFDEHDWENAREMSADEKEKFARDVDQALRQGAILAGKMNGNKPREIDDLLKSKVDWREVMRDFISSICMDKDISTWRRPNRRWVDQGVYLPSLVGESVGRIVVGVDTSGSIRTEDIGQFLGELKAICDTVRPDGIDLLYWDNEVCQHEKYEIGDFDGLLASTKPAGGGGTRPQCIVDYIKANKLKPECAVILTDGYVDTWGAGWTCPVLWGITTKDIEPTVGVGVYID